MNIITTVRYYGVKCVIRRIVREFISPTTSFRRYYKFLSPFFYHLISKPSNFIASWKSQKFSDDTLYFFYDFDVEPITYDFAWALSVANAYRQEQELRALQIILVPGTVHGLKKERPKYEKVLDHNSRIWRIHSIIIPCIHLLACPYSFTLCATREEAMIIRQKQAKNVYPQRYNLTIPVSYEPGLAVLYPDKIMGLCANNQAKTYVSQWLQGRTNSRKVIVVTLRQYAYTLERNSNIAAWSQFASTINEKNYFIVFISDTEQALQPIPNELQKYAFFNEACWNLHLRAAIYELAYLNLGVNTGPMALCWFNAACRYITFKTAVKNVPEAPLEMLTKRGFIPGLNPNFANSFQKWVWEDDNFDIIAGEFKMMCDVIDFNDQSIQNHFV